MPRSMPEPLAINVTPMRIKGDSHSRQVPSANTASTPEGNTDVTMTGVRNSGRRAWAQIAKQNSFKHLPEFDPLRRNPSAEPIVECTMRCVQRARRLKSRLKSRSAQAGYDDILKRAAEIIGNTQPAAAVESNPKARNTQ